MPINVYSEATGEFEKGSLKLYPFAHLVQKPLSKSHLVPKGITIHYTAGASAQSSISYLMKNNLGYHLLIDRDGAITQMYNFDSTCSHAGNASWNNLSPNRHHIAIAFCNFGVLTPTENDKGVFENMYGGQVPSAIFRQGKYWEPATHEQEDELIKVCLWLCKTFNISYEDVCGHHECCLPIGRKIDPGGTLGFSMNNFRLMLKNLLNLPDDI